MSALLCCALVSTPLSATQRILVGEISIRSGEEAVSQQAANQQAMRAAIVRATGDRRAADDPIYQSLIADADRYVQIRRPATATSPARITLDSAAIERAIDKLGRPRWVSERPSVLGVILSAPRGADPVQVREALEMAAEQRGLPLRLSSASAAGLRADELPSTSSVLDAARRVGADIALIGEADGSDWQWTLVDASASTVFPGDVTAGIEGTADVLALASQSVLSQPLAVTRLRVSGLRSLKEHLAVERAVAALIGVKQLEVLEVGTRSALFEVYSAGGERVLIEALKANAKLVREGDRRDPLTYRYLP
ncbi:MAG: DUF2066 domain-containing protein [Steroidobacteraceae bacterium]